MATMTSSRQRTPAGSRQFWTTGAIIADVALLCFALVWQMPNVTSLLIAVFDIDQSAGPDVGVNLREVAAHTSVMVGRTVTVSAEIDDILSPHVMTIGNDNPFFGNEVVIVSGQPWDTLAGVPLDEDDVVQVTGEVRLFDTSELERELGIELDSTAASAYHRQPMLLVKSLTLDPPIAIGPGDKEFPSGSSAWDIGVTIPELRANPNQHLEETVMVSDEIEEGLLTSHAFLLGDTKLLVISPTPLDSVFTEATAYVTGTVRRFALAQIEAELGLDLPDEQFAPFEGNLVIIADSVEVVA
jgi:hypothetical protein